MTQDVDTAARVDTVEPTDAVRGRRDRKYLLTDAEFAALCELLGDAFTPVAPAERYATTYFDNATHDSFRATANRRRRRFKVRVRSYLDRGRHVVEVKMHEGPRAGVKVRTPCSASCVTALDAEASAFVQWTLQSLGAHADAGVDLRPVLTTTFTRREYAIAGRATRITVDDDLAASTPDGRRRAFPGLVALEAKGIPRDSPLAFAMASLGVRPHRLSKFGAGVALLDPNVTANDGSERLGARFRAP